MHSLIANIKINLYTRTHQNFSSMAAICGKCNKDIVDDKRVDCDGCRMSFHYACTELTASEIRVIELKTRRVLKYLCDTCQEGMRLVPVLKRNLEILEQKFESFKSDILLKFDQPPRDNSSQITLQPSSRGELVASSEDIMKEVLERQQRMNNVMVFNMAEDTQVPDSTAVQRIFGTLCGVPPRIVQALRVDKANKYNRRALKVTLSGQHEVQQVLSNKNKLNRTERIYISTDLSPKQREELNKLKEELTRRREAGEADLVIKYINNCPRLIKKN